MVYENKLYPEDCRKQAALVASKVRGSPDHLSNLPPVHLSPVHLSTWPPVHLSPDLQVYYHLGSYEDSLTYALGAGELFNSEDSKNQ